MGLCEQCVHHSTRDPDEHITYCARCRNRDKFTQRTDSPVKTDVKSSGDAAGRSQPSAGMQSSDRKPLIIPKNGASGAAGGGALSGRGASSAQASLATGAMSGYQMYSGASGVLNGMSASGVPGSMNMQGSPGFSSQGFPNMSSIQSGMQAPSGLSVSGSAFSWAGGFGQGASPGAAGLGQNLAGGSGVSPGTMGMQPSLASTGPGMQGAQIGMSPPGAAVGNPMGGGIFSAMPLAAQAARTAQGMNGYQASPLGSAPGGVQQGFQGIPVQASSPEGQNTNQNFGLHPAYAAMANMTSAAKNMNNSKNNSEDNSEMTLRDKFALVALQNTSLNLPYTNPADIALVCYAIADAMLARRMM